jgi:Protein of unknown function (DUF1579)
MSPMPATILLAALAVQAAPPAAAPLPCNHEELRQLAFLRDGWSVTGSWLGPEGVMVPVRGDSRFSAELGGCLVAERFQGTMNAAPFASLTLFAYDAVRQRLELVHSDSLHGSLLSFTGSATDDGLAFEAEIRLSRTFTLRQEYRKVGQTIAVERKRRFEGSGDWTTVWKATYQKSP